MKKVIIAAKSENNVIGKDNDLVWHLPGDLKFFKEKTRGKLVIMGRKTFESIGRKPLPGRPTIIITGDADYQAPDCEIAPGIPEALELARQSGRNEVFILGGATIYEKLIGSADLMYITEVHTNAIGDTYFPEIDTDYWKEIYREYNEADDRNQFAYSFVTYIPR